MADQKKSIAEIIDEMRRELRENPDSDADLFAPYIAKKKSKAGAKKSKAKKKLPGKKKKGKAGAKKSKAETKKKKKR